MRRAVADVILMQIAKKRLRQTDVARRSGVARSYLQALLRAQKNVSLCVCVELGHGLGFEDDTAFLQAVMQRWAQLREDRLKQRRTG